MSIVDDKILCVVVGGGKVVGGGAVVGGGRSPEKTSAQIYYT